MFLSVSVSISLCLSRSCRNSQLQHENGELTGELKSLKKKVKEYEKSDMSASLRAELDHTQSNLNAEIHTLKKQVIGTEMGVRIDSGMSDH